MSNDVFKVTVIGTASVGKTSVLTMLSKDMFNELTTSTIGATYISKQIEADGRKMTLHVWDTAGQERFKSIVPMYLRGSQAAIVMFSVDIEESVDSIDSWVRTINDCCDECFIYIVSNKIDLGINEIHNKGKAYADENGYVFRAITAKSSRDVEELFLTIAEDLGTIPRENKASDEIQIAKVKDEKKQCKC